MAAQHIAFDIPEEILLAEKTDTEFFARSRSAKKVSVMQTITDRRKSLKHARAKYSVKDRSKEKEK